ncbi:MAG: fumarylacetoacetate hydrolase family protein [Gammaproteobacteria bacterium]|nr:fumarylacetoacetate hydrolase family protein [Gammaproteobacteria bacterium]MCY4276942.1 fumarylacetoacetate hydrolase family protein [Gammaproteobacteria bacterium]
MLDERECNRLAAALHGALRDRSPIAPFSKTHAEIDIDDAYRISRAFLDRRKAEGERVIGKKIGVTSAVVQKMLGIDRPDFGFLTDAMWCRDCIVDTVALIAPRAEAEIAFRLAEDLVGPGITPADVLDATECVMPCFEIVDSRIRDWRIGICDTIADNASCGLFVLGTAESPPASLDLKRLHVTVHKNGEFLSEGAASMVQGAPENAVAWLANTLGQYGIPFRAGEVILSGSLVPLEDAVQGDVFRMDIPGLGGAEVRFT